MLITTAPLQIKAIHRENIITHFLHSDFSKLGFATGIWTFICVLTDSLYVYWLTHLASIANVP